VETFSDPREFVENKKYVQERTAALAVLDLDSIDESIVDIVSGFATLPHCFTQQSCFGHFICSPGQSIHSRQPIPHNYSGLVWKQSRGRSELTLFRCHHAAAGR